MQKILQLSDPAWLSTLPRRVAPYQEEWLPGLLLRCDEINQWGSRTTLAHLLHLGPEKFHRCWRTETPNLVVIQPSSLNLDSLAQVLAIPTSALLPTTYHAELTRLYDQTRPHPKLLNESFTFHLCPECLAEARMLRRTLALPHLTICPQHHVVLVKQCQCGASLQLFHQQVRPFTCHTCGLDWSELPRIEVSPECFRLEQKLLSWYEFFFSQGTPLVFQRAMRLANGVPLKWQEGNMSPLKGKTKSNRLVGEPFSLGALVALLVKRNLSPCDLRTNE